ncbi:MAG: tRNA pseudouridine(38-40) synthase TruA [Chloroflexi bacterium]|nr:tRNA pseudouridine(38-40) synthase TruA [Chloroflexota bacterium]|tara:strand:- start:3419 stop:4222 length:804 start_codon:yes stop_codon:yes gene_type:complete
MFVAAVLEYDGTNFSGSQFQKNSRTVQGELELALHKTFNIYNRVKFASRTDSGVHSLGQIVLINIDNDIPIQKFPKVINDNLPLDIRLREIKKVNKSFDPRRDALAREYIYKISLKEYLSPFESRFLSNYGSNIDFSLLKKASSLFEGVYDFKSFSGSSFNNVKSSVRRILNITCVKKERLIEIRVLGNSFIHQQLRRMVALMIKISQGEYALTKIQDMLFSNERKTLSLIAPPNGLYLSKILYADGLFDTDYNNQITEVEYVNSSK